MTEPKTLECSFCNAEFMSPELMVDHMTETGHATHPRMLANLREGKSGLREELIAILMAIQIANSPEEIGATPVSEEDEDGECWNTIKLEKKN